MEDMTIIDKGLALALWMADFSPEEWEQVLNKAALSKEDTRALTVAMLEVNQQALLNG